MDYVALGRRIRVERKARKWTQAQLAQQVNLSISYLGHVERGSRKASLETIIAIANCLRVTPDFLLADSLQIDPSATPYNVLNANQRKVLREIVERIGVDLDKWPG